MIHMLLQRLIILVLLLAFGTSCVRKPNYFPGYQREINMMSDLAYLNSRFSKIEEPLTLDQMIDIAICNNLELLVKEQEIAINKEIATSEWLKILPWFSVNNRITGRTHNTGSSSVSLDPLRPPAPPSISRDRFIEGYDWGLSWTLLDFGMAFYRSRQEMNRTTSKWFQYQRMQQNMILEIVKQYWKAIAAKRAVLESTELLARVEKQKNIYFKQLELRMVSDVEAILAQNRLIKIELDLVRYEREYHVAKNELALNMGIPPITDFEIAVPDVSLEMADLDPKEEMEQLAMESRPELYEKDALGVIAADEIRIAILEMFPNLRLFWTPTFDSNSFLVFNNWIEFGATVAWNLLSLPSRMWNKQAKIGEKELVKWQRLALSLAVMTQVNVSYLVVGDTYREFKVARDSHLFKQRMLESIRKRAAFGEYSEAEVIIYEADALITRILALETYAEYQTAIEQLNNAIGIPLKYGTTKHFMGSEHEKNRCCALSAPSSTGDLPKR